MNPIKLEDLTFFAVQVFEKCGVSNQDAVTAANVLVTTDSWGVFTHGTKALYAYTRRLREKGLNPQGRPRVKNEGAAWAVVDGDSSLGMVTGVFAMNLAIKKAASSGIAMVVVRNSCHFGAAGFYAKLAASQGQVGIAMSNDVPSVAAPRSLGPVLGSNPFAFAASSSEQGTMVLDMATSEVAGGKVAAAAAEGKLVPATWLVDAQGQPTTDPNLFLKQQASLAPMAGYKGYGIALMIEILSGALSGASMRKDVGIWMLEPRDEPTDHGHAFISIAPAVFLGEGVFPARLDDLLSGIRGTPVQGGDHVKIPGDIEESKAAKAQLEGIQLPEEVLKLLRVAATENGLSIPVFLN